MKGAWLKAGLMACCLAGYFFAVFPSLDERLMGDEVANIWVSEYYAAHGAFPASVQVLHIPLYLLIYSSAMKWFGATVVATRLVGIMSVLVILVLIAFIARRMKGTPAVAKAMAGGPGGWLGVMGWALICFNPLTVHGSLIPDHIDTLAPMLLLAAVAHEVWCAEHPRWAWVGRAAVLGTLAWSSMFSAVMLSAAYMADPFIRRWREGTTGALGPILLQRLAAVAAGWAIFAASWAWYCGWRAELIEIPFKYLLHNVGSRSPASLSSFALVQNVSGLIMWITPWYAAMALAALWAWMRGAVQVPSILVLLTLGNLFVYLLGVGAVTHGMPKYHYPFVSLSSLIVARWLLANSRFPLSFSPRPVIALAVIACIFFALQVGFIGDPIYALYYRLREAVILNASPVWNYVTIPLAWKYAVVAAGCAAAAVGIRRWAPVRLASILLACYLGSAVGMLWLQARAPYFTNYCYGGSRADTEAVLAFLRNQPFPPEDMLLTSDLCYYLGGGLRAFTEGCDGYYSSPGRFLERAGRAKLIVAGLAVNGVTTYRTVLADPAVQTFLASEFDRKPMESYTVWLRKSMNSHDSPSATETSVARRP